jgi:hypothetical protein
MLTWKNKTVRKRVYFRPLAEEGFEMDEELGLILSDCNVLGNSLYAFRVAKEFVLEMYDMKEFENPEWVAECWVKESFDKFRDEFVEEIEPHPVSGKPKTKIRRDGKNYTRANVIKMIGACPKWKFNLPGENWGHPKTIVSKDGREWEVRMVEFEKGMDENTEKRFRVKLIS